ncbi:AAA family ATPase, partial [Francisella tularensis subsp. holarctica]|uniref:AAA family ATPase n=1 Tax=Francisella tularensis TaxID=263 RepID=UPI002381B007
SAVSRNYIETILSLPWGKRSKVKRDINLAEKVLEKDHYGIKKVKVRILEHLAVQIKRDSNTKAPILGLVGPPGVGKTSLGQSIASATGREYVRMALGGV